MPVYVNGFHQFVVERCRHGIFILVMLFAVLAYGVIWWFRPFESLWTTIWVTALVSTLPALHFLGPAPRWKGRGEFLWALLAMFAIALLWAGHQAKPGICGHQWSLAFRRCAVLVGFLALIPPPMVSGLRAHDCRVPVDGVLDRHPLSAGEQWFRVAPSTVAVRGLGRDLVGRHGVSLSPIRPALEIPSRSRSGLAPGGVVHVVCPSGRSRFRRTVCARTGCHLVRGLVGRRRRRSGSGGVRSPAVPAAERVRFVVEPRPMVGSVKRPRRCEEQLILLLWPKRPPGMSFGHKRPNGQANRAWRSVPRAPR